MFLNMLRKYFTYKLKKLLILVDIIRKRRQNKALEKKNHNYIFIVLNNYLFLYLCNVNTTEGDRQNCHKLTTIISDIQCQIIKRNFSGKIIKIRAWELK